MSNDCDRRRIASAVMTGQSLTGVAKPSKCSCSPSSFPHAEHTSIGLCASCPRVSREIAPMYCPCCALDGMSPSHRGQIPMSTCLPWILFQGFIWYSLFLVGLV